MQGTSKYDPLNDYAAGLRLGGVTSPLRDTRITVRLAGGLATVATSRLFMNASAHSIEAVLTWPVPTAAIVHGLAVHIGDRVLRGEARERADAREAYETALADGHAAVLHEEALKGIHVLSIGQVPPGAAVEVGTLWTMPAALRAGEAELRIPTTVGEIYGRDPLLASDALLADGPPATARIAAFGGRHIRLNGTPLAAGSVALAALDLPIVVRFEPDAAPARGRDPDGRGVSVAMTPSAGHRALDLRVLIDCSGSTGTAFDPTRPNRSVWEVSGSALEFALGRLRADDAVVMWDFDHAVRRLGSASGPAAARLVALRRRPSGGTEIGAAIAAAGIGDVLVVTDGQSTALDPLAVAKGGARVSALLVGPRSLDAAIGHAVALTGGTMAVVGGEGEGPAEAAAALSALLVDLRGLGGEAEEADLLKLPTRLAATRGGARIEIAWGGAAPEDREASSWLDGTALARAGLVVDPVAAYAAGLALPRLAEPEARRVAVAHGLVTHLTSLLVVDRAGEGQEGVPEQHKVALPRPRGSEAWQASRGAPASPSARARYRPAARSMLDASVAVMRRRSRLGHIPTDTSSDASAHASPHDLVAVARGIHWGRQGPGLSRGDLSSLGADHEANVRVAAALPEVAAATRVGQDPVAVVISLMARSCGHGPTAERIAARLKRIAVEDCLDVAAAALGLAW